MAEPIPAKCGYVHVEDKPFYWEFYGTGERDAVCLLNGVAMSTRSWFPSLPLVLDEYDVILYDYWGQGNSFSEDVPYSIPRFCDALTLVVNELGISRFHIMGISYGGFIALDYARLYQERLHTMTLSGILLTHERLFEMYRDLSMRLYETGQMELYAHYLYEKIFGETFVRRVGAQLAVMCQKMVERYTPLRHCLIRLTAAQDRLFADLDQNLTGYCAIRVPTLIMAGAEDRTIPPWVQKKICSILPNTRYEAIPDSGHVVYLEKPALFFGALKAFAKARSLDFVMPA